MLTDRRLRRLTLAVALAASAFALRARDAVSQDAPAAPASARQIGTVRSVDASSLTLSTDKGDQVSIALSAETRVVQLPVGSTDLKTAQPAAVSDVNVGDRVLAIGSAGQTPLSLTARRLVLMKSSDIAQRRAAEQAGWQHGSGGIVRAVDAGTGAVSIASGSRTINVTTSSSTVFRRYAPTSARFEDATASTLAQLHPGDQMRVRGERGEDGTIKADEIVSGSFRHLSGTILAINASANQVTVKDAKTSKPVTLSITPGTAVHRLPPEVAARFAARTHGSAAAGAAAPGSPAGAGSHGGSTGAPQAGASRAAEGASAASGEGAATSRAGAGDLSQVVSRLPDASLTDFKAGDAVMVVGTDGSAGSIAALTLLGGVEPILAASPSGGAEMALSPWSMGGGGEAGGGSAQ